MKAIASGLLVACLVLAGCRPDLRPPHFVDRHPIQAVSPNQTPVNTRYTTATLNDQEYRISPYPPGKPGGALTLGQLGEGPKTFNVWASYDATSSTLGGMLTAGLVDTDPYTGGIIPALAKHWTIDPDKRTYRVTLRKGLRWSDGHPLTSHDVWFTWAVIIGKGLGNPSNRDVLTINGQFPTVRVLDDLTIEFVTPEPFAPFLRQLTQGIAPAHVFEPLLAQQGESSFATHWGVQQAIDHPHQLVSCGMWVLHQYEPGEKVIYRRNPHYWTLDTQHTRLPYLSQYVMRFVKDMNGMALQFEQGQLDTYGVSGKELAHVRQLTRPDFTLYNLGPGSGTNFVAFNLSKRRQPDGQPVVNPVVSGWFHTMVFRQAIDWAIDRQVLVHNILKGVGQPLFTAEGKASPFVNPDLVNGHPRDLNKARHLLQQGGFTWDAQGLLHDAQGHLVRFSLYTNTGNDEREAAGVSVKQDLADLGITVDFKPMEFNVLVGKMQGSLTWESILLGLTGSSLEPNDGANVWRSNGGLHLFNQRNVQALGNTLPTDRLPWEAEIDTLLYQGAVTLDPVKRKQVYYRMQAILYQQQPMVYLYTPVQLVAVQNRLRNVYPTPLGGALHNLDSVWVQ
jgi:peptide/nickel transport system substrate-binding protein